MNKKIIKKLLIHLLMIFIIVCMLSLFLSVLAGMPAPDIMEFDVWGWCKEFESADDCNERLYTDGNLSTRVFRYYFVNFFQILFALISIIYGIILLLKWLWKQVANKTNSRN